MIADQATFVIFILLAILSAFFQKSVSARKLHLFIFNSVFLFLVFFFDETYLFYLGLFFAVNFILILLLQKMDPNHRTPLATLTVSFNILFLMWRNYPLAFGTTMAPLALVGLAFAVLRVIHIVIDLQKQRVASPISFLDLFNYILFFPAFMAGPLDRYDHFVSCFLSPVPRDAEKIYFAIRRCVVGLFKIVIVAKFLVPFSIHSVVGLNESASRLWPVILATIIYSAWLYFSFSGTSDLAIGLSAFFGIPLPENFNRPYAAVNLQEFWSRWHMTLMDWVKDYLFNPSLRVCHLVANRMVILPTILSLLFSFAVIGAWHGQGLHFLFYGLYHGAGLSLFWLYKSKIKRHVAALLPSSKLIRTAATMVSWLTTWTFVSFGWIIFLDKFWLVEQILKNR